MKQIHKLYTPVATKGPNLPPPPPAQPLIFFFLESRLPWTKS